MSDEEDIPKFRGEDHTVESMLSSDQAPTYEPTFSMTDPHIKNLIIQYFKFFNAPDLLNFISIFSHLNATSHLTREEAIVAYCDASKAIMMSRIIHRRNISVSHFLGCLENRLYIMLFGDSEGGKRQKFLSELAGARREFTYRGESKQRKSWWRL